MPFWVIGAEYTDTSFAAIAGGRPETRLGPFASYEEAKSEWAARAWASVRPESSTMRTPISEPASTRTRTGRRPASASLHAAALHSAIGKRVPPPRFLGSSGYSFDASRFSGQ